MESELFGSEKGAYSGANEARRGLIESAQGGTLFLDEIGDLPLALQGKLLRVIQEGEYRRLGSTRSSKANVRFLSATHRDLREEVKQGRFREDLLFRLDVVALSIVPLRERMEDLPLLVSHFLAEASVKHARPRASITDAAMLCLQRHFWPGNVRELANVLERAVILSSGNEMDVADLPPHLRDQTGDARRVSVPVGTPLKEMEDLMIQRTLDATGGDKNMTAKLLGINSRTIYRKLEKRPPLK